MAVSGAGIFVTTVVAGAVCVVCPFSMMQRPFLRDVIFYIIGVFFTFCILYDGHITLPESIGMHTFCVTCLTTAFKGVKN